MASSCKPKNIDVSAIRFSDIRMLDNGSKMVYLNYKGGKLYMQTPLMSLPYGVNDSAQMDAKAGRAPEGKKRYDMTLSFRDMDRNRAMRTLHDKLVEIGELVIDTAFKNRQTWFRNDYKGMKEFVENMYTPLVKVATDKETGAPSTRYPPTLKIKLPYEADSDTFKFECQDFDKNPVDFAAIKDKLKGAQAQVLFQITGLWFAGGKFGCTAKAVKMGVQPTVKAEVDFEDDSDDERTTPASEDDDLMEDALAAAAPTPAPAKKAAAAPVIPDSDEEEEEVEADEDSEEESDREPTPPPPPPKKKATTKTTKK